MRRFPPKTPSGLNVAGFLSAESGIGQSARNLFTAAELTGMPVRAVELRHSPSRTADLALAWKTRTKFLYDTTLIIAQPDSDLPFFRKIFRSGSHPKRVIGYWTWEFESVPSFWKTHASLYDQIWVPSNFVKDALQKSLDLPVSILPPPLRSISHEVIPMEEGIFTFFFQFDYYSGFERKNPLGIIEAFSQAFSPGEPARLIIKCTNAPIDPANHARLLEAIGGKKNITLIDGYTDRATTDGMLASCDVFVSLHRSEGFGLSIVEAMSLGKPVIATGYSGNMDYMNENNSFPVGFTLTELAKDFGPYKRGGVWAEPDIHHASTAMRSAYHQRDDARKRGLQAQREVRAAFDPLRIAQLMKRLLAE
jgi:glycosyltransferase involved in cell wall biosynthesis